MKISNEREETLSSNMALIRMLHTMYDITLYRSIYWNFSLLARLLSAKLDGFLDQ
jgi:hypothetical protein